MNIMIDLNIISLLVMYTEMAAMQEFHNTHYNTIETFHYNPYIDTIFLFSFFFLALVYHSIFSQNTTDPSSDSEEWSPLSVYINDASRLTED